MWTDSGPILERVIPEVLDLVIEVFNKLPSAATRFFWSVAGASWAAKSGRLEPTYCRIVPCYLMDVADMTVVYARFAPPCLALLVADACPTTQGPGTGANAEYLHGHHPANYLPFGLKSVHCMAWWLRGLRTSQGRSTSDVPLRHAAEVSYLGL